MLWLQFRVFSFHCMQLHRNPWSSAGTYQVMKELEALRAGTWLMSVKLQGTLLNPLNLSPPSSWQLGHEPLARLSFPEAVPSLEAGDDLKLHARGSETLWQNHDMEKKERLGELQDRGSQEGDKPPPFVFTIAKCLCSSSSNCSERKEIEKLFLHP